MSYQDAKEIASSLAAQIGEDRLATMPAGAIVAFVRKDRPGDSIAERGNISFALQEIRNDLRR